MDAVQDDAYGESSSIILLVVTTAMGQVRTTCYEYLASLRS
jgi:hypothetical protein